jgi:hypothetical protein
MIVARLGSCELALDRVDELEMELQVAPDRGAFVTAPARPCRGDRAG